MIQNKASGAITLYKAMFHLKPRYNGFRVLGLIRYIHIPEEKRLRLEAREVQAHVIAHLDASKGWLFCIAEDNTFATSAMVRFPNNLLVDKSPTAIVRQAPQSILKYAPKTHSKLSIDFIMNVMQLGNFSNETELTKQELIIDKILYLCSFYSISVPKTFKQAMRLDKKDAWSKAIAIELSNLEEMRVLEVLLKPSEKKELVRRSFFATKPDVDGSGVCFKAQYVAKGFTQVAGQDFNKTIAPTATFVSLRILLTIAVANNWPVHSFEFVAAYLNSPIEEEIWVKPPEQKEWIYRGAMVSF